MDETSIAISDVTAETMGLNPDDQMAKRFADTARRELEEALQYVSPAYTFRIPELLDKRRMGFAIPDRVFQIAPMFERVFLWPLPDAGMDARKASKSLWLPENSVTANEQKSPRCLIVGAGMRALDILRSNGSDLGHIVYLVHLNPWWIPCGRNANGKEWWVRVVSVGDIGADEDLATEINAGRAEVVEDDDRLCRLVRHEDGATEMLGRPLEPGVSPEY